MYNWPPGTADVKGTPAGDSLRIGAQNGSVLMDSTFSEILKRDIVSVLLAYLLLVCGKQNNIESHYLSKRQFNVLPCKQTTLRRRLLITRQAESAMQGFVSGSSWK